MWKWGYSGAVICPSNRRTSAAWTSQTSSGKYWSHSSQIHLEEKTDEEDPGEIHARSSTLSSGYCAPERPGRISRTLPSLPNLPPPLSEVDRGRDFGQRARNSSSRSRREGADRSLGVLHRSYVRRSQKRGGTSWKDQAGQRYETHGVFRRLFCSSRPPHREC